GRVTMSTRATFREQGHIGIQRNHVAGGVQSMRRPIVGVNAGGVPGIGSSIRVMWTCLITGPCGIRALDWRQRDWPKAVQAPSVKTSNRVKYFVQRGLVKEMLSR